MAQTFVNPANGHKETVNGLSSLFVLLFGGLYLIAKGLWAHVLIWFVAGGGLSVAMGVPIPIMIASVIYAIIIQGILGTKYMRQGWKLEEEWEREKNSDKPLQVKVEAPREQISGSVADELRKLSKLKDDGLLTDEEFATQKMKILSQ